MHFQELRFTLKRAQQIPALILFLTGVPASAGTVYKYIGPDGSITYSDTPPTDSEEYDEIDMPEPPAINPEAHRQTTQEMSETADKLRRERLDREKNREPQKATATPPPVVVYKRDDNDDYRTPYWYYRDRYRDRRDRIRPPYRQEREPPRSTEERLKENLRSPIEIPRFGE